MTTVKELETKLYDLQNKIARLEEEAYQRKGRLWKWEIRSHPKERLWSVYLIDGHGYPLTSTSVRSYRQARKEVVSGKLVKRVSHMSDQGTFSSYPPRRRGKVTTVKG